MTKTHRKWVQISDNTNAADKSSDIVAIRISFSHSSYDDISTLSEMIG